LEEHWSYAIFGITNVGAAAEGRMRISRCIIGHRPIEKCIRIGENGIGEGIIGFWLLMNLILVFRPQTTVQNFIKCDSKYWWQERWEKDRHRRQRFY